MRAGLAGARDDVDRRSTIRDELLQPGSRLMAERAFLRAAGASRFRRIKADQSHALRLTRDPDRIAVDNGNLRPVERVRRDDGWTVSSSITEAVTRLLEHRLDNGEDADDDEERQRKREVADEPTTDPPCLPGDRVRTFRSIWRARRPRRRRNKLLRLGENVADQLAERRMLLRR